MNLKSFHGKAVLIIISLFFLVAVLGQTALAQILFQDNFSGGTTHATWSSSDFSVVSETSTPDGDGYVYQRTNPDAYKSAQANDFFTIDSGYNYKLSAFVKIGSVNSGEGASTTLGFKKSNNDQYYIMINFHAPNLVSLAKITGGVASIIYTFDVTTAASPLALSAGDWIDASISISQSSTIEIDIKKWLGSAWSDTASTTYADSSNTRDSTWGVIFVCFENPSSINTTHNIDNIILNKTSYQTPTPSPTASPSPTPTSTPTPSPTPTVTPSPSPTPSPGPSPTPIATPIIISSGRQLTYIIPPSPSRNFGAHVFYHNDRYLMYFSHNGTVKNGKPSNLEPGDSGTYNNNCSTWWADRIWLTWHLGDGKDPAGWDASDGVNPTPPILMLSIGGAGEGGLIGDPTVVYWNGQWHMYYEATDRCDGRENLMFHATATNWIGPWTKQGRLNGLRVDNSGSLPVMGPSWPSVLIEEDNNLYLYYIDGNVRLLCARATDTTGQNFEMIGGAFNPWVYPDGISEGVVVKEPEGYYRLICDNFPQTAVGQSFSANKFNFPSYSLLFSTRSNTPQWENTWSSLPCYLKVGNEHRIYYTGSGTDCPGAIGLFYWTEEKSTSKVEKWEIY